MKKSVLITLLACITVALAAGVVLVALRSAKTSKTGVPQRPAGTSLDPYNATYIIEGKAVTLDEGESDEPIAPDSATHIETTIYDLPTRGDLNGDKATDAAILLVQNPGGSGLFFYLAAAVNDGHGNYRGTNALLLGDRIAPQNIQIKNGVIIANYADRQKEEPLTTPPSVGVSKYAEWDGSALKEIARQNELIRIDHPAIVQDINSPLTVYGQARGTWYFEAVFPMALLDESGAVIAEGQAKAKSDWMTEDFVPFEGTLTFTGATTGAKGTLILKKDNPSGLPEHDASLSIPVVFR